MAPSAQIADLQQRIANINAQIAQAQASRDASTDVSEQARLEARIALLQQTRQALQTELNNLQ